MIEICIERITNMTSAKHRILPEVQKRLLDISYDLKLLLGIVMLMACSWSNATATTFEMVVLPDTQYYSADSYWFDGSSILPHTGYSNLSVSFRNQTNWIVANRENKNIVFVSHLGDVVDDSSSGDQWNRAVTAMNLLSAGAPDLPYGVCMGNHDYIHYYYLAPYIPNPFQPVDSTDFQSRVGWDRYASTSWYPQGFPDPTNPGNWISNAYNNWDHYQFFSGGGYQFLHITLSDSPTSGELDWAQKVISAYPNLPTVISTHDYLQTNGVRSSVGNGIWQNLVKINPQVFMVLCGHVYGSGSTPGAQDVVDLNDAGQNVLQVLSDFQNMDYGGYGYLREMIFDTGANGAGTLTVDTYTPTFPDAPDAYLNDSKNAFAYNLTFGPSLVHIGALALKTWNGGGGNQWNLDTANKVWQGPACYGQDEYVRFDDTAASRTINVADKVTPFNIIVDNSPGNDYIINSSSSGLTGTISGFGKLTKQGGGKLTIAGVNSFTGGADLLGGTIAVHADANLGDSSGKLTIGAATLEVQESFTSLRPMVVNNTLSTIQVDSGIAYTCAGTISGLGGLNKWGAGTLTLTAMNTYNGNTYVNDGTLIFSGGIDPDGTTHIDVQAGKAVLSSTNISKSNLDVVTAASATFEVADGTHLLGDISGSGMTLVDSGGSLTVTSISQGILTIGGLKAVQAVPEPSILVTLGIGALGLLACAWRRRKYEM
jgi:autotransporter-associated beta strand protein